MHDKSQLWACIHSLTVSLYHHSPSLNTPLHNPRPGKRIDTLLCVFFWWPLNAGPFIRHHTEIWHSLCATHCVIFGKNQPDQATELWCRKRKLYQPPTEFSTKSCFGNLTCRHWLWTGDIVYDLGQKATSNLWHCSWSSEGYPRSPTLPDPHAYLRVLTVTYVVAELAIFEVSWGPENEYVTHILKYTCF